MDGGGVVGDGSLEVGVYLKVVRKIFVLPSLSVLCLIELHQRRRKIVSVASRSGFNGSGGVRHPRFANILYMHFLVTVNDKVSMLVSTEMSPCDRKILRNVRFQAPKT